MNLLKIFTYWAGAGALYAHGARAQGASPRPGSDTNEASFARARAIDRWLDAQPDPLGLDAPLLHHRGRNIAQAPGEEPIEAGARPGAQAGAGAGLGSAASCPPCGRELGSLRVGAAAGLSAGTPVVAIPTSLAPAPAPAPVPAAAGAAGRPADFSPTTGHSRYRP